jgi:hypothetical protein
MRLDYSWGAHPGNRRTGCQAMWSGLDKDIQIE